MLQGIECVPSVQKMMSAHCRSRFISVFKSTGRHLGRWEVFSDFCHSLPVNWISPG
jgi:hypothetical protein